MDDNCFQEYLLYWGRCCYFKCLQNWNQSHERYTTRTCSRKTTNFSKSFLHSSFFAARFRSFVFHPWIKYYYWHYIRYFYHYKALRCFWKSVRSSFCRWRLSSWGRRGRNTTKVSCFLITLLRCDVRDLGLKPCVHSLFLPISSLLASGKAKRWIENRGSEMNRLWIAY